MELSGYTQGNSSSQIIHNKGRQKGPPNEINLLLNTSTGRKAFVSEPPLPSGHPLTYSTGGGRQLFVFVTLETAIHIVLGDNLQFNIMEYGTIPYVGMALASPLK